MNTKKKSKEHHINLGQVGYWIKKMLCIYKMEYYSAMKNDTDELLCKAEAEAQT